LKHNLLVLCIYLICVCTALYFIFTFNKQDIHLYLNSYVGNGPADLLFKWITWLGDGTMAVFLLLILLIFNVRLGLYATASFLTASLASFGLKRLFFDDMNRPFFIFNYHTQHKLKLVEGVDVYIHNSFPSGHATQAFAILMCLAFVTQKHWAKHALLLLALLTSYSRVHLSQHWLVDITAGSMVGMLFALVYYYPFVGSLKFEKLNRPVFVFLRIWRSR
jgi:membrane-associated phospholipid phosphatase